MTYAEPRGPYKGNKTPGVYYSKERSWWYQLWKKDHTGQTSKRHFATFEECEYARHLALYNHHWYNMPHDTSKAFGFLYKMTHQKTGLSYIGSKQFYYWDGPRGGFKCTDPSDEWWDPKAWKHGNWETYCSSSVPIGKIIERGNPWDFKYECIGLYSDRLSLIRAEIDLQVKLDVLNATDDDGNYLYLNANIARVAFRPPFKLKGLKDKIKDSKEALREYYLKPRVCESCMEAIPFGETRCPNAPLIGDGPCK